MWNCHGRVLLCYAMFSYQNCHGMVEVVTGIVGVVTGMVGIVTGMLGIVTGMGNCHRRVGRLELLRGIVGVITGVVGDIKFVTGVFVVTEWSMALGRIPFDSLMGIIIGVFYLSRLSWDG